MTKNKKLPGLLIMLLPLALCAQPKHNYSVSGTIKDKKSGETLSGATVGFLEHPGGIVTNSYGFYSITIPEGKYSMIISYSGYATDTIVLDLKQNTVINKMMSAGNTQLKEVVVAARKGSNNILKTPPGLQRLSMEDIQNVPVLLGEKDVLKTIQMLPGVKSAGDGNSGFYVRGGAADQNLILLDEATVYNPTHFLGFFSAFNSDAIKDLTLYKGAMPAEYGGRLSSVVDIKMNDGNINITSNGNNLLLKSKIDDASLKQDFQYFLNSSSKLNFGFQVTHHIISPAVLDASPGSNYNPIDIQKNYSFENALYISHEYAASDKLRFNYGLRFSSFLETGPGTFNNYDSSGNIKQTKTYESGQIVSSYYNLEPRFS